jgi:hypothetical protein
MVRIVLPPQTLGKSMPGVFSIFAHVGRTFADARPLKILALRGEDCSGTFAGTAFVVACAAPEHGR